MIRYAPAYRCGQVTVQNATVSGLAYPAEGPRCCAIELVSASRVVGMLRADRFSDRAAALHIRDGWCGFDYQLRSSDFVFDDTLMLRCAVSRRVLHVVTHATVAWENEASDSAARQLVTVAGLLTPGRTGTAAGLSRYESLIRRLAGSIDKAAFVSFAFQFLLGRDPDPDGRQIYFDSITSGNDPFSVLEEIALSDEHTVLRRGWLPSPFDEQFPAVPVFLPTRADPARR
jgi:hypothetical protein